MVDKIAHQYKSEYTDKYVQADSNVPELARFAGMTGRVVTVNENALALVDFGDGPWYDIAIKHLTVVPKPKPAATEHKAAPAKKPAPAKKE